MKLNLLICLLILSACSFKKSKLKNQTQKGHTELYSQPSEPSSDHDDEYKKVIIAATNDIHGHYRSHEISFTDSHNGKQSIIVGGVDYISSYFKILRQMYGQILLVDSGDIFSKKSKEMNYTQEFYGILEYDALTVGLKDFNLKLPEKYHSSSDFLKDFSAQSKTPLILSNLYDLKTARVVEWAGTLPYLLKEVNGVKVGIIGLIPDDIVGQTPVDNRVGMYVENMLQSTMRHSRLLRSLGAEIIVVLTHQGLNCGEETAQQLNLPLSKVNFEPEKKGMCDLTGQLGQYLNRLPPHLVDVVVGGRNHQKTANYVNDTLVLSNFEDAKSFSYVEFVVNTKTKKIKRDKTVVHQPVTFCQEFFKETNDCYTEDPSVDHKVRTPAVFLGQKVERDPMMDKKFELFLKPKQSAGLQVLKNIQSILDFHDGDITYIESDSNESKLMLVTLNGAEILKILEDDYNQGLASRWQPSPFTAQGNSLILSIQGSPLVMGQQYKVLASLDDLQNHQDLKHYISRSTNKSLNSISWIEPGLSTDTISTTMSASETVR